MSIKRKYIIIILFITTMEWALWTGGQFFNALMVVPGWSYSIPKSIQLYQQNMLSHIVAYFFMVVNPAFLIVPAIVAWVLSLKIKTSFRIWFGMAVLLDLIITLTVGLWMAPTARRLFADAVNDTMNVAKAINVLHTWKVANACRIGLEIVTLFFFLLSVSRIYLLNNKIPDG